MTAEAWTREAIQQPPVSSDAKDESGIDSPRKLLKQMTPDCPYLHIRRLRTLTDQACLHKTSKLLKLGS